MSPYLSFGRLLSAFETAALLVAVLSAVLFAALALSGARHRALALSLRMLVAGATLLLFFRGSWVTSRAEMERRTLAVVVDRSASMTLPVSDAQSRWDEARELLKDEGFWNRLKKDFDLRVFTLDDTLKSASLESLGEAAAPVGCCSPLTASLQALLKQGGIAGVVLLSDGVDTESEKTKKPKSPSPSTLPIVAVYPGLLEGLKDLSVTALRVPAVGFFRNRLTVEVDIELTNLPKEGIRVELTSGSRRLVEQEIPWDVWKGNRATIEMAFSPDQLGDLGLTVDATRLPEEVTHENNRRSAVLTVLRDRIRVLHVAGEPSYDERFLRSYLKDHPNIDLISFFILRQPTDNPEAGEKELSLIPFPYHELFSKELENFDVVIFQNFDFRTYFVEHYLANLRSYVEKGGSFVFVGGNRSFGRGRYRETPVEDFLPVTIRDDPAEIATAPFRAAMAMGAADHPILSEPFDLRRLAELPPFWGYHRTGGLQPGSSALLKHSAERNAPVIAVRLFGQGRSAAIMVDSLWRWAFSPVPGHAPMYAAFWTNLLRWLVHDPAYALLKTDLPSAVSAGEKITLEVKALTPSYAPLQGKRIELKTAERSDDGRITLPPTGTKGETQASVTAPASGLVDFTVTIPGEQEAGYRARAVAAVEPKTREFDRRGVDVEFLKKLANDSRGETHSAKNVRREKLSSLYRNARLVRTAKVEHPLWDHPLLLVIILVGASFEWWYRRKHGGA